MTAEQIERSIKAAREILTHWPIGSFVWHRSNGKRGVVNGVMLCGDGAALPQVTWGDTQNACFPFELSGMPIPEGTDGEEWRLSRGDDERQ